MIHTIGDQPFESPALKVDTTFSNDSYLYTCKQGDEKSFISLHGVIDKPDYLTL